MVERDLPKVTLTKGAESSFLAKPNFSKKPAYVKSEKKIWTNLYQLSVLKNEKMYVYSIKFEPEIAEDQTVLKRKLIEYKHDELKKVFGNFYFISGDNFYSTIMVDDPQSFELDYKKTKETYFYTIIRTEEVIAMNFENTSQNKAIKMLYELIIKSIIRGNPDIEYYRNLFVKTNEVQEISSERSRSVKFFPGYDTSVHYLDGKVYLNVAIKNKIISNETCLQLLNGLKKNKATNDTILEYFQGASVKTTYSKKNYVIDELKFDKNPGNVVFNHNGETVSIKNYYKATYGLTISDVKQPLFTVKRKRANDTSDIIYLVPEFCLLAGLDDQLVADRDFMTNLALFTKLDPKTRVEVTNSIQDIMFSKKAKVYEKNGVETILPSANELRLLYEMELLPTSKNSFYASVMTRPVIKCKNKTLKSEADREKVHKGIDLDNWMCVYHKENFKDAESFLATLQSASTVYGITVKEPYWQEESSKSASDWIKSIKAYVKDYQFVLFILDNRKQHMYSDLKKFANNQLGFISQVVKAETIRKKGGMAAASKILLQINAKLGGCTYLVQQPKEVLDQNIMFVGVDSSHIKGRMTAVAMCATINKEHSEYSSDIQLIHEKNKETLIYTVSKFLSTAVKDYFKVNKKLPGGVIIYRQGVSKEQKEFLEKEVENIELFLKGKDIDRLLSDNPIPFNYILVNTKTKFKFFDETAKNNKLMYNNPDPGLLVMDGATDPDIYEFFIQPQQVTQGTATPTNFHVAYGDLKLNQLIPKITYDLCFSYPNWQGPVRVPAPLKNAEKLAKLTAKYTRSELNENIRLGLPFL